MASFFVSIHLEGKIQVVIRSEVSSHPTMKTILENKNEHMCGKNNVFVDCFFDFFLFIFVQQCFPTCFQIGMVIPWTVKKIPPPGFLAITRDPGHYKVPG